MAVNVINDEKVRGSVRRVARLKHVEVEEDQLHVKVSREVQLGGK